MLFWAPSVGCSLSFFRSFFSSREEYVQQGTPPTWATPYHGPVEVLFFLTFFPRLSPSLGLLLLLRLSCLIRTQTWR